VQGLHQRIDLLLSQVGLTLRRSSLVSTFSRGMKQRLAIARALLHDPSIVLLDEPFTGLDQRAADMLAHLLRETGLASRTVIMTTHNLEQALGLCRRAVLLVDGTIRAMGGAEPPGWDNFREAYRRAFTGHVDT
jgi:ABC-type multidrug transport system ATPase subunit